MYDKIIIGAGIYGLYAALNAGKLSQKVLVLEKDNEAFSRATYINQARVHMGYHYPRSYSTAIKSRNYFDRFVEDYGFCILKDFKKIYATSRTFSWTSANEFEKFCHDSNIYCKKVNPLEYFRPNMCDGVFETQEYTYDAHILRDYFLDEISKLKNVEIKYNSPVVNIEKTDDGDNYRVIVGYTNNNPINTTPPPYKTKNNKELNHVSPFILNATYASINEVISMLGFTNIKIKYELCEIILCQVDDTLKNIGITVMDGPFFSIMPFGKTGLHSLTSVTFTPHITSYNNLPTFSCQKNSGSYCTPNNLGNCNICHAKPETAYPYMSTLAKKYLNEKYSNFSFKKGLFSMKPILMASEIDDSRPTVIKCFSEKPYFYSVLSGKINTLYDLEDILK